ncbi:MAG TPA: tetratricopeptide repeat protein [Candidatus Eisenbacteria bacterium]
MASSTRRPRGIRPAPPAAPRRGLLARRWPLALAAVFLLAWAWRFLYLQRLSHTVLAGDLTEDARSYWVWSGLLLQHGFLGKNPFFLGPLYPYALAVLRLACGDSIGAVLQVQALWGALAAALLADAARRLARPSVGLAIGALAALHPMAVFFDGLVLMESLLFFLEAALLWWVARAGDAPPAPRALLVTGVLIALVAEGRATAALLLVPAALFLLPWRGVPRLHLARSAVALAAGFALVALPVALRTRAVSGEWIPFTYNFGFNLYAGNNPEATSAFSSITGTHLISPAGAIHEDGAIEADGREYLRRVEGLTLGARASSDVWAAKAWRWMREHPRDVARLTLRKLGMMWSRREYPQIENADEFALLAGPLGLPVLGSFAFLSALALPGLALAWRRGRPARFVLGYVVVVTLSVLPFFVVDRYRHHLVPGVLLLGALTIDRAMLLARGREVRRLMALAAGAAAGLAVAFAPVPAMSTRKFEWGLAFDVGTRWLERGRPDLAADAFARATRLEPGGHGPMARGTTHATERADLYYNYGLALTRLQRDAEARAWFERAVEVAPDRAPAICALADACVRAGEKARAESLYAALATKVGGVGPSLEGRGIGAAQEGRLDEAAALFERAVRADPNLASAWGALIRAQLQLGRLAAAESSLARAGAAGLPLPALRAHQALVEALAGGREAAERALAAVPAEAIAADPVLADVVSVARRVLGKAP